MHISPALKKPKKQVVKAAHSMILSWLRGSPCHCVRMLCSIAGVIGNLDALPDCSPACDIRIPRITCCRRGMLAISGGLWFRDKCNCLTADRYTFIVIADMSLVAKYATNLQSSCSDVGIGL